MKRSLWGACRDPAPQKRKARGTTVPAGAVTRNFDRRVAKPRIRIASLNGCTAPGIPVTEAVGQVCPEKRGTTFITRFMQQGP